MNIGYRVIMGGLSLLLASVTAVAAETIACGPFSLTNGATAYYPQFPSSTGFLHSITIEITNFCVREDIVYDNDSTNAHTSSGLRTQTWHPAKPIGSGEGPSTYGPAFSMITNLSIAFSNPDDGDGQGTRDGGPDEVVVSLAYSNLQGTVLVTNTAQLAANTGHGDMLLTVVIATMFPMFAEPTETYSTNMEYSGTLNIRYEYSRTPLVPRISTISTLGVVRHLQVAGLSVGSSNLVDRCSSLNLSSWSNVDWFVSSGSVFNVSDTADSNPEPAFYRILSQ